jgi:hypothetical protein
MRSRDRISLPDEVKKYLDKYSSAKWHLEFNSSEEITAAVIIPAIKEFENLKKLLQSLLNNDSEFFKSVLIIFVINNPEDSSSDICSDNQKSITFLNSIKSRNNPDRDFLINKIIQSKLQIGFADASSPGKELPKKTAGVGLARKIGMDLALTVFNYTLPQNKILICLDADCTVEKNYLSEIIKHFGEKNFSAAAINFNHKAEIEINAAAIICYEIFLRYYVAGLNYADSHYAFHTIGSSMACDYKSYVKAEGMNKRKAAEDFYFLQKLAKITDIKKIKTTTVFPSSRNSWRVPFGTGQRVGRFISQIQEEYLLYDLGSFEVLKLWLQLFNSNEILTPGEYLNEAEKINRWLCNFLILQNFEKDWKKIISVSKNKVQLNKQKIFWFDGFRTLKLIHYLRDNAFPLVNMFDALDSLFVKRNIPIIDRNGALIPSLEVQREYLETLKILEE